MYGIRGPEFMKKIIHVSAEARTLYPLTNALSIALRPTSIPPVIYHGKPQA
jgi:hypothetical protein